MNNRLNLIPKPQKVNEYSGSFTLNNSTIINYGNTSSNEKQYLSGMISEVFDFTLKVQSDKQEISNSIILEISYNNNLNYDCYNLSINSDRIKLLAGSSESMFYGLQTLRQMLLLVDKNVKDLKLPNCDILDYPRFKWRGMHLDVSRHFFSTDFIKKYIDMLVFHKLNIFHWHICDDQGWRIELEKFPELTEIGAWRKEKDGSIYGGFYSKEEVKDIIQYATNRHITIIPEIEMPGHSLSTLAAYPQYSCRESKLEVWSKWGVSKDVFCAGKESTFEFIESLLFEVIKVFPSKYIHIGGDECPKDSWRECSKCQKRIFDNNLKDEFELQSYFIQRVSDILKKFNRKLIGWDEISEGGLAKDATVMIWRGDGIDMTLEAIEKGHNVILCPNPILYFDWRQTSEEREKGYFGVTPLKKVYDYNPFPKNLPQEKYNHVLGVQANVWTEYMKTEKDVEYMAFPRLCALAEVAWVSEENKNYADFLERLSEHKKRLYFLGISFCEKEDL